MAAIVSGPRPGDANAGKLRPDATGPGPTGTSTAGGRFPSGFPEDGGRGCTNLQQGPALPSERRRLQGGRRKLDGAQNSRLRQIRMLVELLLKEKTESLAIVVLDNSGAIHPMA